MKYLLAASLMVSSAEFASDRNLRIVEPYLLYYAIFNCSRTLLLMLPEQQWKEGEILESVTHSKAQNVIGDYLRLLSPAVAERYRDINQRALTTREMLSYRFPAQGLRGFLGSLVPSPHDVIDVCQFLAEAAQLHSECAQTVFKDVPSDPGFDKRAALRKFFEHEHKLLDAPLHDDEDWYRLWQFTRHSSVPWSLHLTARPGLVEDFFGAWVPEKTRREAQNHTTLITASCE